MPCLNIGIKALSDVGPNCRLSLYAPTDGFGRPESETLSIRSNAGFTELVTGRGFDSTRNSQYKKPGRFADYMLIHEENAVRDFDVIHDPEVSDYCPLVLEI